jgi:hypothetical protein
MHQTIYPHFPFSIQIPEQHFEFSPGNMTKTIQEQLAEKPHNGDPQPVQYIGTVEAYDKWAEVCSGAG